MKKSMPLNQNSGIVSLFYSFLWISAVAFGMIYAPSDAQAAEKLYNVKGKRDPFVQLVGSSTHAAAGGLLGVETLEEIVIEGIMADADPKNSIVVVNGSVLKEGQEAGTVKVLKIDPKGVLFSVNGIEGYRPLYEETKKATGEKNN